MSDEGASQTAPTVFSSKERAALVAKALSEAARRARFSTRRRRTLAAGGFRARRSDRVFRFLRAAAFVGVFMIPTTAAIVYFGLIASDQFVAEARFTVRGGMPPSIDRLGGMTGAPTELIIQDTQVIMNFIQSRTMVDELNRAVGLEKVYSSESIDWFARLGRGKPIEKILKYWKSRTELSVQMPSGIVVFSVRAFSPEDSVKLADAALDASDALVNRMNERMVHDAVDLAEKERERALKHLVGTRAALERARNEEGILNAGEASKALDGLISEVRSEMIKIQQQYDSQRRFVSATAPQLRSLNARIVAAQDEITKLEGQRTESQAGRKESQEGKVLSGSMSKLEYANLENAIAEKIYAGSMAALEQARLASETKLMYINTFVRPVAAEEAKYPRRVLMICLVTAGGLAAWACAVGLLVLLRDRLA